MLNYFNVTRAYASLRRFAKEAVTENLPLKLVALIVAILLIVLLRIQEEAEGLVDVQIDLNLPADASGIKMTSEFPETVRVRLQGPRSRITSLNEGDVLLEEKIDLSGFKTGLSSFYFSADLFEIPPGLTFVRVTPESVSVKMEPIISRWLPVQVITVGEVRAGAEIVEPIKVVPTKVAVTGAASIVRSLKTIETEDLEVDGTTAGRYERSITARHIDGVEIHGWDDFTVRYEVRWIPGRRVLAKIPIEVVGTALDVEVRPKKATVVLTGPQIALDAISAETIVPTVQLTPEQALKPAVIKSELKLRGVPENLDVESISPAQIKLTLKMPRAEKGVKGTRNSS